MEKIIGIILIVAGVVLLLLGGRNK